MRYETHQKIRLCLGLDVHVRNPCSSTFFFGNFMAFIPKKINVRGEFSKDDSLDTLKITKEYRHNAMVILEDHVMVLYSGEITILDGKSNLHFHPSNDLSRT